MGDTRTIRGHRVTVDPDVVRVTARCDGDELVVTLHGEADACSGPGLRAELVSVLQQPRGTVVVDLADLHFCDLGGMDAISDFVGHAAELGIRVRLCGMSDLTRRLFTMFRSESLL